MTRLLLIRHGQSVANIEGFFAGNRDLPLTAQGIAQAELAAEYIAQNYSVDAVYASDLSRAFVTGEAVAKKANLPLLTDIRLREIRAGLWEGCAFDVLQTKFAESYGIWLRDIGNAHPEAGESVAQLQSRVVEAVKEIACRHNGQTVVIATHATPIRALQCYCKGLMPEQMKEVRWVSNASVTEVFWDGNGFSMGRIAIDSYLGEMTSKFPANV